jgi:uncharacterized alpha-E superfamily protein
LRFAVDRMEQAVAKIGSTRSDSPTARTLSALWSALEENTAETVLDQGLHEFLNDILRGLAQLHEAVQEEYFAVHLEAEACAT